MKQFFGMSQRGNLDEALQGLYRPQFIMLLSNNDQFDNHVALLEKRFPAWWKMALGSSLFLTV